MLRSGLWRSGSGEVNRSVSEEIRCLRQEMQSEFGNTARMAAHVGGPLLAWSARREELRLAGGKTYEPPTFLERRNWIAADAGDTASAGSYLCANHAAHAG